jgi:FkbM family methyltransferase
VRHLPLLERWDWLWNALRLPYEYFLEAGGRGVLIHVGGHAKVRIPAAWASYEWQTYEPETVRAASKWAGENPGGLFLDIGCSVGIISAVVRFAGQSIETIAFDSDLASLQATRAMCKHAPSGTLRLVYGFVSESGSGKNLASAEADTDTALSLSRATGKPGSTRYMNLGDRTDIPSNTIDDLLLGELTQAGPVLLKSDIEGAELFMLRGAKQFLLKRNAYLLISVHPTILPRYHQSPEDVRQFLTGIGYKIHVLGVDHEEHWWCSPEWCRGPEPKV